jgi:hypothetical protein
METPKILSATISPPIFVDSRKSARDYNTILVIILFFIK